ncbi:MAG: Cof-type HAD-IIB family hydrolase [Methylocystaceae bacterium]
MDIKLVACDLDDTLLRPDLTIAPGCRQALQAAVEQGIVVTIATGRMFRAARPYAEELGISGVPLIVYQGAWVRTLEGKTLYYRPLETEDSLMVLHTLREYNCHYHSYYQDELYMEKLTPEGNAYSKLSGAPINLIDDLEDVIRQGPLKFLIINYDYAAMDKIECDLKKRIGHKVSIVRSKPQFLEISHLQATKAHALQAVSDYYHIDQQNVMAIGDSYNDMDMITWAGVGVAMANAPLDIREQADYVTLSNQEGGVAAAINRYILQPQS